MRLFNYSCKYDLGADFDFREEIISCDTNGANKLKNYKMGKAGKSGQLLLLPRIPTGYPPLEIYKNENLWIVNYNFLGGGIISIGYVGIVLLWSFSGNIEILLSSLILVLILACTWGLGVRCAMNLHSMFRELEKKT